MQIARGVHQVKGILGGNVYLLDDTRLTLVDAGLPGNHRRILQALRALGREPEELAFILITHGHPDHYGSAAALQAETGARVLAHVGDAWSDRQGRSLLRYGWVPGFPSPVVDGWLQEGQRLPVLDGLFVYHTPGHTPGSVSFHLKKRGVLFTGDTALTDGQYFTRPFPFPGTDWDQHRRSLERLGALTAESACPGHGRPCLRHASERIRQCSRLFYEKRVPLWWKVLRNTPGLAKLGLRFVATP